MHHINTTWNLFSPIRIFVRKKSWEIAGLIKLLLCLAENIQLRVIELPALEQFLKVFFRQVLIENLPLSLIFRGIMTKLCNVRKLLLEQNNVGFCNFLRIIYVFSMLPHLSTTCGMWSPRMLNISGISFDLTGKSTESGWSTGSELTSNTQGCSWESNRISRPRSLKQL